MMQMNVKEEYLRAQSLALREKKELESQGLSPYPVVLEEVYPQAAAAISVRPPFVEIPAHRIVGTVSGGRASAFSASFLPLPDADTEFGAKWIALCKAHLSDAGIREPVECVEYLGDFYVSEGNKRVSVLRYFGAVRIPARVRRILPQERDDPRTEAYFEFLDFYRDTGIYDIQFTRPGEYAKLLTAVGKKQGDKWSDKDVKSLASAFFRFREAFSSASSKDRSLIAEDALLLFLKVYTYDQLTSMSAEQIRKALTGLWNDIRTSAEPDTITVKTVPDENERKTLISKLITGTVRHMNIAFICQSDAEKSTWTQGHAEGAAYLADVLGGSVSVRTYFDADSPEEAEKLIHDAVSEGADIVFTTTPPLLDATLRSAVTYPKVRFYNCSACQPLASVRSYYCRTYEGKFITGAIAGALADNDLIGYIGSYPILGEPASINAFALGARMTNPRARIVLEWSATEFDCVKKLRERGVRVISNRDIPVPDVSYLNNSYYGTFMISDDGGLLPVASPVWVWGKLYENIVRNILSGSPDKKEDAVNYWWGMDSGAMDIAISDNVPDGLHMLADILVGRLRTGEADIFTQKMTAQDGSVISDGITPLSSLDILRMDKLMDTVEGHIPEYEELFPFSRALVRELGVYRDRIPPGDVE